MRRRLLLFGFALNAQVAFAQHLDQEPIASTPPPSAVYEIVQTSRAMKETYLLNRYTGQTWQLVQVQSRVTWRKIQAEVHNADVAPKEWKGPIYQMSISGIAAKGTYLINTFTGAMWVLYEDPKEGIFWGAIPAPN
jgi:hypothetical protein